MEEQVIISSREYGINTVLFRHSIGEILKVNVTDMECLGVLFFKGIATPSELAKYTGLSSGATTAMLDRLEKAELIKRRPNPADRRGVHITINKKALSKVRPLFSSVRTAQNDLLASYSEKELQVLINFFTKASAVWEEERKNLKR